MLSLMAVASDGPLPMIIAVSLSLAPILGMSDRCGASMILAIDLIVWSVMVRNSDT